MADKDNNNADSSVALDDVMIAMDVVDTLRHDEDFVDRELNSEGRKKDLIKRLRQLYKGQGIDVPDHVLEEGVKALEDGRFVYEAPKNSFMVRLAKVYVSRHDWGKKLTIWVAVAFVAWLAWSWISSRPPEIQTLMEQIKSESRSPAVTARAKSIGDKGLRALKVNNNDLVRSSEKDLRTMLNLLRQSYTIRIVSGKGRKSAIWRVPKNNPRTKNYYLIVEAVDKTGKVLPQNIKNEETGKFETVSNWGIRVSDNVYETVKKDKIDDGIIQNAIVAEKVRGYAEPKLRISTLGGSITRW